MKRTLLCITSGLILLILPTQAQERSSSPNGSVAPTDAQYRGFADAFLDSLPRSMDAEASSQAKDVGPAVTRLMSQEQIKVLRQFEDATGPYTFGERTREERDRLMNGGVERLSHPDTREWLRLIDSFDF